MWSWPAGEHQVFGSDNHEACPLFKCFLKSDSIVLVSRGGPKTELILKLIYGAQNSAIFCQLLH